MTHANNPKNLSQVFIGGFDAAVYWDQRGLHKNAPRAKEGDTYTRIKREYYAPSSGGKQVPRIQLPTAKSPTYCYFPVKLVQDVKLRNRQT
jgi:hypothetical protein